MKLEYLIHSLIAIMPFIVVILIHKWIKDKTNTVEAKLCTNESRVQNMSLCKPTPTIIGSDGSLIEKCDDCGIEWLWLLDKDHIPHKVMESHNFSEFKEIISLELEDENNN